MITKAGTYKKQNACATFVSLVATLALAFAITLALPSRALADCGDGNPDPGEECDNGANNGNTKACLNNCVSNICGDGFQNCGPDGICGNADDVEACDDGDSDDGDFCLSDCTEAACGDGITCTDADCSLSSNLSGPEACDDANAFQGDDCKNDCTANVCGDGVIHASGTAPLEECDKGTRSCSGGFRNNESCTSDADCTGKCTTGPNVNAECTTATAFLDCAGGNCDDSATCSGAGNLDGDGTLCLSDCRNPFCGDGFTSGSEVCDDGNSSNDDSCVSIDVDGDGSFERECVDATCADGLLCTAASCTSGPNSGVEECDPGSLCVGGTKGGSPCTIDSDCAGGGTCTAQTGSDADQCRTDCASPSCGDNITDSGEDCDDGTNNADDSKCLSDCTDASCGDGFTCSDGNCTTGPTGAAEECDDGDSDDSDFCLSDCSEAVCGDGSVCSDADCDTSSKLTEPEECDDGNLINTDSCNTSCVAATCGDAVPQPAVGEECDFGPGTCDSSTGCPDCECSSDADCPGKCRAGSLSPAAVCDATTALSLCGKLCDVGGSTCIDDTDCAPGDTCEAACAGIGFCPTTDGGGLPLNVDEPDASCRSDCKLPRCGDGITDSGAGEECDDGNSNNDDLCVNLDIDADGTVDYECVVAICRDGVVCSGPTCTTGPGGGPEECDPGSACSGGTDDGAPCLADTDCGGGGSCAVSTTGSEPDQCRPSCALPSCGDGTTDSGEECDDGDTSNNNDCLNDCTEAACGDGLVCDDAGCTTGPGGAEEACDDAGESTTCNADCSASLCGDDILNTTAGEQCDDGNTATNDGCNATCQIESCGDGEINNVNEDCEPPGTAVCDSDCTSVSCGDGTTNTLAGEECDDGRILRCDGGDNADKPCVTNDDCPASTCTLGTHSGDGCDVSCTVEFCGDGLTNNVNEDCDPGSVCVDGSNPGVDCTGSPSTCIGGGSCQPATSNEADACRPGCINPSCGDGTTDPTAPSNEACDDGNSANDDGCVSIDLNGDGTIDNACVIAACGDGVVCSADSCTSGPDNGPEECDPGSACSSSGDPCLTASDCGGGGETCDPLTGTGADQCRDGCEMPTCGDTFTDSAEQCDDGNTTIGDGCTGDCCLDGTTTASAGLSGSACSLDQVGSCDVSQCKRKKAIERRLDRIDRFLTKATASENFGKKVRAEKAVRRARRLAKKLAEKAGAVCKGVPDAIICLTDKLDTAATVLKNTEASMVSAE